MYISIKLRNGSKIEHSTKNSSVTIGRSTRSDFEVSDEALSRFHAQIDLENGQYYITDLGSSNGVFLDDQRIPSNQKTPFATYMALHIGPLECVVQNELELDFTQAPEISDLTNLKKKPERIASVSEKTPRTHQPERIHKKPASAINPKILLTVLFLTLGVYLLLFDDQKDLSNRDQSGNEKDFKQTVSTQRRKVYRPRVPNQNTIAEIYISNYSNITCTNMNDVCKQLQIEDTKSEGLVIKDYELFIYVKPSKLYAQSRLARLKEQPSSEDLLGHYLILGSELMQMLLKHEVDQIHAVVVSNENRPVRAYRYHISQFENGEVDLPGLIDAMSSSIRSQQTKEVAENLMKIFPPLNLHNP